MPSQTFLYYVIYCCVIFMCFISAGDCKNATRKPDSDFPLNFGQAFQEASDMFRKVINKMIANKKFLGVNSEWSDWYR